MKISWFNRKISPEVGVRISGYAMEDFSVAKLSDLYMTGLLADDGERKVLLISFDLQCFDEAYIRKMRGVCGELLGIPQYHVMLTCTHTHGGPQTNAEAKYDDHVDHKYLDWLEAAIVEECRQLPGKMVEANPFFYSLKMDENMNRRIVTADNYACFMPHRAELRRLADGFRDQELGLLFFMKPGTRCPLLIIGNYAAHPLASHSIGKGSLSISADYPGYFRDCIMSEADCDAMFVSGACGDMVPREDELGEDAARQMGIRLAKGAIRGVIDATRNPKRFMMDNAKVGAISRTLTVPLRKVFRNNPDLLPTHYLGRDTIDLEMQCLSIGDVCFVGVPGELCAELGQEIKWHSPFRKAFIAFNSTAYQDYISPANFQLQGGYEAKMHHFSPRKTIEMIKTAIDAMFDLRDELHPLPEGQEYDCALQVNQLEISVTPISMQ